MNNDYSFLGDNITHWTQSIRRGYAMSFLLSSFHDTGVFELLKDLSPKSSDEISKKLNLNKEILESGLNFLANADNSIIKDKNKNYQMTEIGKKRIFSDQAMAMALGAVGAYHVLFTNYTKTLTNELTYGKDFIRDGRLVAKSSVLTGRANYPWVAEKLAELKVETVVDLGCGSGDIIIDFCKREKGFKGVGLDIDPTAIEVARENVIKSNLQDRIDLITGDMLDPKTYSHKISSKGEKVAFNAIMALHEFLIDGDIAVINVLKKMKKEFPGSFFILGEFNKCSDDEFSNIPIYERMHMLFYQEIIHGLTDQGLASLEKWKEIFEKADVELVEYKKDFPFRLVEYVLKF